MSLHGFLKGERSIATEVVIILKAENPAPVDTSTYSCRLWVREFIQARVSKWRPGLRLTHEDAMRVGAAFEVRLKAAKTKLGLATDDDT